MKNHRIFLTAALAVLAMVCVTSATHAQGVLFVENNMVGVLTSNPTVPLDIEGPDAKLRLNNTTGGGAAREVAVFANNGGAYMILTDLSQGRSFSFATDSGQFFIDNQQTGPLEFQIDGAGNVIVGGSLVHSSSREVKNNIVPVSERDVLNQVLGLPIAEWSYNADGPGVRHIGPMAEDFYDVFQVGLNNRSISDTDTAGIALAAIKGLHEVVAEKDAEIAAMQTRHQEELASLLDRVASLERSVGAQ